MPLKLSLKPGERFVLNGAVVQNGEKRSTLVLQNKASVLREKDIMHAEEVTTPARRIYFPVMMMYLSEKQDDALYNEFVVRMTDFMGAISDTEAMAECVSVSRDVMAGEFYKALIRCRKLIEFEDKRLSSVGTGLPNSSDA